MHGVTPDGSMAPMAVVGIETPVLPSSRPVARPSGDRSRLAARDSPLLFALTGARLL